jgi:hypothetical protein
MVEYLGRFLVYFREFGRALGEEICRKVEEAASGVSVNAGNRYFFSIIPLSFQRNVPAVPVFHTAIFKPTRQFDLICQPTKFGSWNRRGATNRYGKYKTNLFDRF